MNIRFPRKIDQKLRPVYGLTARELVLLGTLGLAGGLVVLAGEGLHISLTVRVIVALGLVALGGALAFIRVQGQTIEKWLLLKFHFLTTARRRVWRKGEARPITQEPQPRPAPKREPSPRPAPKREPRPRPAVVSLVPPKEVAIIIVAVEVVLMFSLTFLTLYLYRGGLGDLQRWLRYVFR